MKLVTLPEIMPPIDALILAGGGEGKVAGVGGDLFLAPLTSRPLIDYVVGAVRGCPEIRRIGLVGSAPVMDYCRQHPDILGIPAGEGMLESLANGVTALAPAGWLLVATGDIPLLTTGAVQDFLERCRRQRAQFYYAIVRKEVNEAKYPGTRRTYVRLKEGTFCGGNLFLVWPEVIAESTRRGAAIVELRKNPLGLVRLIGFSFIMKYIFHNLTLQEAEERFSRLLGLVGVTIETPYAEVGIDVDKPEDMELIKEVMACRGKK